MCVCVCVTVVCSFNCLFNIFFPEQNTHGKSGELAKWLVLKGLNTSDVEGCSALKEVNNLTTVLAYSFAFVLFIHSSVLA